MSGYYDQLFILIACLSLFCTYTYALSLALFPILVSSLFCQDTRQWNFVIVTLWSWGSIFKYITYI